MVFGCSGLYNVLHYITMRVGALRLYIFESRKNYLIDSPEISHKAVHIPRSNKELLPFRF